MLYHLGQNFCKQNDISQPWSTQVFRKLNKVIINIMTYILYKLVYNISRKTANIWNWSFTNLFLVITDQYWLRKCRTYLILPWCSLERDIFVFLLKNFVMNFIVVPRRLLLSSQNSDHLLSLTLAKFLYAVSVYLQAFVENILLFYLYLSQ